jgi:histidinol-phosphatase
MTRDLQADLALALALADEADRISLSYFQSDRLGVETKPDNTPVTRADREIEQGVRERIAEARPGDGVLGEEFGGPGIGEVEARWIVDPIDGTRRFMRGVPMFATLLGLEHRGQMVLGVASAPAMGRRWWAVRGGGAFSDGRRIRVSGVSRLADAHVSLGSLDGWLARGLFEPLMGMVARAWSTSGYGDFWIHALVAEGVVDIALEPTASIWDLAALKVIVEEAGGRFTDFDGVDTAAGGSGASSNGLAVHDETIALLHSAATTSDEAGR